MWVYAQGTHVGAFSYTIGGCSDLLGECLKRETHKDLSKVFACLGLNPIYYFIYKCDDERIRVHGTRVKSIDANYPFVISRSLRPTEIDLL